MIARIVTNRSIVNRVLFQQSTLSSQLCKYSSYQNSPDVSLFKPGVKEYDVSRSKDEWKYVERILQPSTVPEIIPRNSYQANWKPPTAKFGDYSYYINRNRNHMIPVYMSSTHRGMRKITEVNKIQGNIYELQKDLTNVIQNQTNRVVASQVNELVGVLRFKGDYVSIIKQYLMEKGF